MGKQKVATMEIGRRFGRTDLERCDLFVDQGFLDWGKYNDKAKVFNEAASKGAQMYSSVPSGGHKKCGVHIQSGYFDKDFKTISVNLPYVEKWKITGLPKSHPRNGPWVPCHPASKHSTPGDNYGTFTKISEYKAFSPLTKPEKKKEKELRNFLTNPGKKGNSGYLDICLNKYPPHSVGGKIDTYFAAPMMYSQKWKDHKAKIRNGPLRSGFYPRDFDENPYKVLSVGPTYVQPKEKVYGTSKGTFYPPAAPKVPGNNHDGCFDKFPVWSADPYLTADEAIKTLDKNKTKDLIFRPQPGLKSYYTVSVVNNKVEISCNERTWRNMKPITYPQFNL